MYAIYVEYTKVEDDHCRILFWLDHVEPWDLQCVCNTLSAVITDAGGVLSNLRTSFWNDSRHTFLETCSETHGFPVDEAAVRQALDVLGGILMYRFIEIPRGSCPPKSDIR
jgi:hypothetical protein